MNIDTDVKRSRVKSLRYSMIIIKKVAARTGREYGVDVQDFIDLADARLAAVERQTKLKRAMSELDRRLTQRSKPTTIDAGACEQSLSYQNTMRLVQDIPVGLITARRDLRLTQEEFGKRVGLSRQQVWLHERTNYQSIKLESLIEIAAKIIDPKKHSRTSLEVARK